MQEGGESWQELARKRRALKVSKIGKYKSGGKVEGEKGSETLGKNKRGKGVPETEDEQELKSLGKDQREESTEWDGMKGGGKVKKRASGGSVSNDEDTKSNQFVEKLKNGYKSGGRAKKK